MTLEFFKYFGAGNDFVMIDNRQLNRVFSEKEIAGMCDRRFGIGADGLMLLEKDTTETKSDFRMRYFNADGKEGSMCGNGGRCIVAFARFCGITKEMYSFLAVDGLHQAYFEEDDVYLKMAIQTPLNTDNQYAFIDTGSPHIVVEQADLESFDIEKIAIPLRFDKTYNQGGSNVNFINIKNDNYLDIRTYERGVEAETWACGTGAVASAIYARSKAPHCQKFYLQAKGGCLEVGFLLNEEGEEEVWLKGNAVQSFRGFYEL